ncbi:hypothetical protein B4U80_09976 [Leptotrombidium deliense]|uniref:Uncharacterized protein n=1 Tax=Leptotrombidium deliense TaxID=299467 RepID=A0A443SDT0_9ACAR|nr:hypothetical protein B4U80_09976 [Leptotrombidium deliense]
MNVFKQKISEDSSVHKVAINKTHRHFFLFTGLFVGCTVLIGLWGVLREYIPVVFGFVVMLVFSFVFEGVGAYKSGSKEVLELKAYSALPELFFMLISLIYCALIRQSEKQLANLPIYRQTMAESRRESLAIQEDNDGVDNPAMIHDEEANATAPSKPYLEIPTKR